MREFKVVVSTAKTWGGRVFVTTHRGGAYEDSLVRGRQGGHKEEEGIPHKRADLPAVNAGRGSW